MGRQLNQGDVKVSHPIHQDRTIPLEVVGQQHQRRTLGELDRGHPCPHRLDSKDHTTAQDLGDIPKVRGHISTRRVHEVELLEGAGWSVTGRAGDEGAPHSGHAPPGREAKERLDHAAHHQIGVDKR